MDKAMPLPRYRDDLAEFLGDLRSIVFQSQSRTARHLQLAHTTISRYENGILKPPPGYIAYLAYLLDENVQTEDTSHQSLLLDEVNKAIQWNYDTQSQFRDWDDLCANAADYKSPQQTHTKEKFIIRADWGEAPDTSVFYGREDELDELQKLISADQTRMLVMVGMAGIGKTSLATQLAHSIHEEFDFVLWRSLRNAPQLDQLLHDILARFVTDIDATHRTTLDRQILTLLEFMRQNRCLLLLDNLEAILSTGSHIGHYRAGYEAYDSFLSLIANSQHRSCVILTSRETPSGLEHVATETKAVYVHQLDGVDAAASKQLFLAHGVKGEDADFQQLTRLYSGNVLALKLVKNTIVKFFDGSIAKFLEQDTTIFTDIRKLLDKTYERVSHLACEILYWLAIERQPMTFASLSARLIPKRANRDVLDAVQALERTSLIELGEWGFSLQNVISEYLIDRLISEVYQELEDESLSLLARLALLTTDASETIRNTQQRLIVKPIADRLKLQINSAQLRPKFERLLEAIRQQGFEHGGFAAGNLLNIMLYTGRKIHNYDFSQMTIQHAYLENATLTDIDFSQSEFLHCLFNNSFVGINTVALSPNARFLAIATSTEVRIWGLWDRQLYYVLRGHEDLIWDMVFLDDEQYLVSRDTYAVHLWNFTTGQIEGTITSEHHLRAIAVDSTRTLLAVGDVAGNVSLHYALSTELKSKLDAPLHAKVYALAFSEDGQYLAAGDSNNILWLWSLHPFQLLAKFTDHKSSVNALAFIPDHHTLISGSLNGEMGLWDVRTCELLHMLPAHHGMISSIKVSGDKRFITSGYDRTIKIWNLQQLDPVLTLHGHNLPVSAIDVDQSGRTLVAGGYDRRVHLWNTRDGYLIDTITGLTFEIRSLAFNRDSRLLAGGSTDYRLYTWDWLADTRIQIHGGHARWISSVAFHPDGHHVATGSYDRTIRVWHVNAHTEVAVLNEPTHWIYSLDYSPDGRWLVAGGDDRLVYVWDTNPYVIRHALAGHEDLVNCVIFHPKKPLLLSGSKDGCVRLWDVESGECLASLQNLPSEVIQLGFQNDDTAICILMNGQVIRWDITTDAIIDQQQLPSARLQITALCPNSTLFAYYETHNVKIYDLERQQMVRELEIYGGRVTCLVFDDIGHLLASGSVDGCVNVWETITGKQQRVLKLDRPYEGMNITDAKGISTTQREMLKAMGAIESRTDSTHS